MKDFFENAKRIINDAIHAPKNPLVILGYISDQELKSYKEKFQFMEELYACDGIKLRFIINQSKDLLNPILHTVSTDLSKMKIEVTRSAKVNPINPSDLELAQAAWGLFFESDKSDLPIEAINRVVISLRQMEPSESSPDMLYLPDNLP